MKYSIRQARYVRSTSCKVVIALAFASVISSWSISSAFAGNDDGRGLQHQDRNGGDYQGQGDRQQWRQDRNSDGDHQGQGDRHRSRQDGDGYQG